ETVSILRGLKERYEVHHGVRITDSAIVAAAVLSNRYITDRFLPDKAIDLIDEAASRLRIEIDSLPTELDIVQREIRQLETELERALDQEQSRLRELQGDRPLLKEEVGEEDIAAVVSRWTGIPVSKMLEGEMHKLLRMEQDLHARVVGQDDAIAAVANAVRR